MNVADAEWRKAVHWPIRPTRMSGVLPRASDAPKGLFDLETGARLGQIMMFIPSPQWPENHPDRIFDCDDALDSAVREIFEAALAAGWSPNEIAHSIRILAYRRLQAVRADKELNARSGQ